MLEIESLTRKNNFSLCAYRNWRHWQISQRQNHARIGWTVWSHIRVLHFFFFTAYLDSIERSQTTYLQEAQSLARQGNREKAQLALNKKKLVEKEVRISQDGLRGNFNRSETSSKFCMIPKQIYNVFNRVCPFTREGSSMWPLPWRHWSVTGHMWPTRHVQTCSLGDPPQPQPPLSSWHSTEMSPCW